MEAPVPSPAAPASSPAPAKKWIQEGQNRYYAAGGVLAIVGLVIWLVILSGTRKEEYAARAFDRARAAAQSGNLPLASSEFQKVVSTYAGTRAAQEAVIALNQVRLENGQGELAIPNLQEFLRTKREPRYAVAGYGLLGSALETAKRPTEAAQAYLSASQAAEYDFLKAEYLLEAGRASTTAGKTEDAIRAYKQVTDQFAKTPANTEAAVRLAELTGGLQ